MLNLSYGLWSSEDIGHISVQRISNLTLTKANVPLSDGLNSSKMGCANPSVICSTCALNSDKCPGHFGHIELLQPVINVNFIHILNKVLTCVCLECSSLLYANADVPLSKRIVASRRVKVCPDCDATTPARWSKKCDITVQPIYDDNVEREWTPAKLAQVLLGVTSKSMSIMGFNFAAIDLTWRNLLIPPMSARPARGSQSRLSAENPWTLSLRDILKANRNVDGGFEANSTYMLLARQIAAYQNVKFQNAIFAIKRESVRERISGIKSKRGRLRATIFGKRNNFTARSVIVCDNSMALDEVGIPRAICEDLYFGETVQAYNIHRLLGLVRSSTYPRARYYSRKGCEDRISIRDDSPSRFMLQLHYGDIMYRDLVEGDYVLLNRQPTLHKQSIMAHKIRVVDDDAFHINISLTTPYSADFDGDECNVSLVMTEQGRAEAMTIMSVAENLLKNGKPIIRFVQHALLSLFMLTNPKTLLTAAEAMQILFQGQVTHVWPTGSVSGRDIFSCLLPVELNMLPYIHNGQLLPGPPALDKASSTKLILAIHDQIGADYTLTWIHRVQAVLTAFLDLRGLSISLDAYRYELPESVVDTVQRGLDYVAMNSGRPEAHLCEVLGKCRDIAGEYVLTAINQVEDHGLQLLVESGAKGSSMNLVQSCAALGQQFDNLSVRTAPTVHNVRNPGYITSSFVTGLNTVEYFHHLVGARAGLVDTAVKTSETGYAARKLGKFLEDCVISNTGIVYDSNRIIQFKYDGADNGTHIGMICAQNLSEPLTQLTLNSFHSSGQENALVSGVARVFEIINCSTSKTPHMRFKVKPGYNIDTVADNIVCKRLDESVDFCVVDGEYIYLHLVDGMDVEAWCDSVEDHVSEELDLGIELLAGRIRICGFEETTTMLEKHVIYREHIAPIIIKGVRQIKSAYVDGDHIVTIGSSLQDVMCFYGVDTASVTSSDILETLEVFGIDMTCQRIQDELSKTMFDSHVHVEPSHVELLANTMCRDGYLRPVTYRGIARADQVLKNASFEKTIESFVSGAVSGGTDNTNMSVNTIALLKPLDNIGLIDVDGVPASKTNTYMHSRCVDSVPNIEHIRRFTRRVNATAKRKISLCNDDIETVSKKVKQADYKFTAKNGLFVF